MSSDTLHHLNILVHVTAGSIAIVLGLVVLSLRKGDRRHRVLGRIVLTIVGISVGAALVGAFVWRGRVDLIGVSILSAYQIWSGVRAIRLHGGGRRLVDLVPALAILMLGGAVLYLYHHGGVFNWSPGLVYGAVGGLMFYGGWDVVRALFPLGWRVALNPAEHAYRMTSLIGTLVSVAAATLLKSATVYVALSVSGAAVLVGIVLAVRAARYAVGDMPSANRNARLKTDSEL